MQPHLLRLPGLKNKMTRQYYQYIYVWWGENFFEKAHKKQVHSTVSIGPCKAFI